MRVAELAGESVLIHQLDACCVPGLCPDTGIQGIGEDGSCKPRYNLMPVPRIVFKTDHSLGSRGDREEVGALRAGFRRAGAWPAPGALSGARPGLVEGKGFPGRGKAGGQGTEARVRRAWLSLTPTGPRGVRELGIWNLCPSWEL